MGARIRDDDPIGSQVVMFTQSANLPDPHTLIARGLLPGSGSAGLAHSAAKAAMPIAASRCLDLPMIGDW